MTEGLIFKILATYGDIDSSGHIVFGEVRDGVSLDGVDQRVDRHFLLDTTDASLYGWLESGQGRLR